MAMDLKIISNWLKEDDTKHHLDEDEGLIVFGAQADVQAAHFIRLRESGELFVYQVQIRKDDENFVVSQDHQHINVFLKYLLHENYTTKFGCWEYDYTDGDIRYSVEIPLEDGEITQKQFKRIISMMFSNVDTMASNILKVLETGEMPDKESGEEMLKKLLLMRQLMEDGDMASLLGSGSDSKKSKPDLDDDGI